MVWCALSGMQWNAVGIHEVGRVLCGYTLGYLGMQGNAEDYMLNARGRA